MPESAGVAHGIAGVVLALDALASATDAPALRLHAMRLRAELSTRLATAGISWCHGLAGIVRVLGPDHAPEPIERLCEELREHLDARHPDLSLCHGLFGAADALVELACRAPASAGPQLRLAEAVGEAASWDAHDRGHWPCGMVGEPPGLMLGLAGIGLGYLRLQDHQVVSPLGLSSQLVTATARAANSSRSMCDADLSPRTHLPVNRCPGRVGDGGRSSVAAPGHAGLRTDWGVAATVEPFAQLDHVPTGYWPIVLRDDVPAQGDVGLHLDHQGQPMALIQANNIWSLTASHEALEMLADPWGNRFVPGGSLKPGQGVVQIPRRGGRPGSGRGHRLLGQRYPRVGFRHARVLRPPRAGSRNELQLHRCSAATPRCRRGRICHLAGARERTGGGKRCWLVAGSSSRISVRSAGRRSDFADSWMTATCPGNCSPECPRTTHTSSPRASARRARRTRPGSRRRPGASCSNVSSSVRAQRREAPRRRSSMIA